MPILYKKGGRSGIYIKPENKGKFTATKKRTGKTTEELTHSKNPVTKKRAIFAQNAKKWKHEKGGKLSKSYINKAHSKPGGSNVGKYPGNWDFAGPSGGAPKGSYPINSLKHAKSALKLAHNAPNPEGIKRAVYKKYPQLVERKKKCSGGRMKECGGKIKK